MIPVENFGWDRLRHGGLLLDTPRLKQLADYIPGPLSDDKALYLRRQVDAMLENSVEIAAFTAFILEQICGFTVEQGTWQRGNQVGAQWTRRAVTGEAIKPRHLWNGPNGGLLPVFIDSEKRLGIGRGRKSVSQVIQWLRSSGLHLAVITNGRQWRLLFAGLDFDAWCEWDADLWFEEGTLSPQVLALRTILSPAVWTPCSADETAPLLRAIQESRKGQAELSAVLGERVREAVEILLQAHGNVLKEQCAEVDPADIYRAAVRMVMRIVVALFAESRDLLPRDNALYHGAYGITGLREILEKQAARGARRLSRAWSAWPRIIALFQLIHKGSHHQSLLVPTYGGELFAPGDSNALDGVTRSLAVFETACFNRELMSDREVFHLLERITRTKVKVRQGRGSTWVPAPVDFSDLSSEYIGILYEGLLDFELRVAPAGEPVVFLSVGNQPALPLSRLEAMDDKVLADLLKKMKDTTKGDQAPEEEQAPSEEDSVEDEAEDDDSQGDGEQDEDQDDGDDDTDHEEGDDDAVDDERHTTRARAEMWARKAVEVGKLVTKPKGKLTPEKKMAHEEKLGHKAHQLVSRVVLPGEWYLVRWGGTRKGAGTFYTRPGLAVPTVQRTLQPLAFETAGSDDSDALTRTKTQNWVPKKPEAILALKVCDPACGSGSFPVAALRYLTESLYAALHHHGRIHLEGDQSVVALITGDTPADEQLCQEKLPCRPDDPTFESRLKAVLRRHVVERCLYGVDMDPLAVELCRLALWIETMDRDLPFSFLDHKIKCGNSLVGAWFDQFQHYPVMAWKNRDGGDKNHTNGVHYEKGLRSKALKAFVKDALTPDLLDFLESAVLFQADAMAKARQAHEEALNNLARLHDLPVHHSAERARVYREEIVGTDAFQALKQDMDRWCACWFWPVDQLEHAPLPATFAAPSTETRAVADQVAARKRFFHWELEFPDVFNAADSGFNALLGNPPWETLQPSSMEYFSNIDPLYRSYGKQEALRFQTDYFQNIQTEKEWLEYLDSFACDSNWMKFVVSPFGDPEFSSKNTDRFSIVRGKRNPILHERWRNARKKSTGYSYQNHPYRYRGEGKAYTYKLFLEQSHHLLCQDGRLGFIVPSGIYSDHGTSALRALFLDHCRWEWVFGFENREGIFDIHRSFKFNPIIIEKGKITHSIQTAFMRRNLEDWEQAEKLATAYSRDQVNRFSPRSKAILEIQSNRDLAILEKIYANSMLLGDDSLDGWGIKYAQGDFNMTSDSGLFPPRPKWEARGYRPDEYNRWIKGEWRPIDTLKNELGFDPLIESEARCTQPLLNLKIDRGDISAGIIFSMDGDSWIHENFIEDIALPLYQGLMIWNFDFSFNGWVSGTGRSAVWEQIEWDKKSIKPQFLVSKSDYYGREKSIKEIKVCLRRITTAVHQRTAVVSLIPDLPCGDVASIVQPKRIIDKLFLATALNLFPVDFIAKKSCTYLHLDWHVVESLPAPRLPKSLIKFLLKINCPLKDFSPLRIQIRPACSNEWPLSALTRGERLRVLVILQAVGLSVLDFTWQDALYLFEETDRPCAYYTLDDSKKLDPKGFWRVDKDKDPELRHTVLTMVAFHDLEEKIRQCDGDRDKGIEAFLSQNDGEGWMLPETLRLADYGLGHDDRAKRPQPVAVHLGPRYFDWQLAQTPAESWRECHLHARNLLGRYGYLSLLGEVLQDIHPDKWSQTLTPACDLTEKPNLVQAFSHAFGMMAPEKWSGSMVPIQAIGQERGFTLKTQDTIGIIVPALGRMPKENRPKGVGAALDILGEDDFKNAIDQLLEGLPWEHCDLWLQVIRPQVGETLFASLTAGSELGSKASARDQEIPADKNQKNNKGVQLGLFD